MTCNCGFSEHDINVSERLARVEGKLDLVLTNQTAHQKEHDAVWENIDEHETRLTKTETEKHVWSKVGAFILTFVSWVLGGLTSQWIKTRM